MPFKYLLAFLLINGNLSEEEAEFVFNDLRGQEVPETIGEIAATLDTSVGKYRELHPPIAPLPPEPKNIFTILRKLGQSGT